MSKAEIWLGFEAFKKKCQPAIHCNPKLDSTVCNKMCAYPNVMMLLQEGGHEPVQKVRRGELACKELLCHRRVAGNGTQPHHTAAIRLVKHCTTNGHLGPLLIANASWVLI